MERSIDIYASKLGDEKIGMGRLFTSWVDIWLGGQCVFAYERMLIDVSSH